MTERYVRDHGVYTTRRRSHPTGPPMRGPARAATNVAAGQGAPVPRRELPVAHIDDMAGRLRDRFAESRDGDKFVARSEPLHRLPRGPRPARPYRRHIADRSYQWGERGRPERHQVRAMWDSTRCPSTRRLRRHVARPRGRPVDRAVRRPEPFFLFVGFPGPTTRGRTGRGGGALPRRRHLHAALDRAPDVEGTGRYGALLNSFLWVSDPRHDRRRIVACGARTRPTSPSSTRRRADVEASSARGPGRHVGHLHQ